MKQTHNNYLALALFFVYMLIAFIQYNIEGLLPTWLYISIAFVTIDITIFESVKNIIKKLIIGYENRIKIKKLFESNYLKQIDIYAEFPQLNEEKQKLQCELDKIKRKMNIQKINIKIKRYKTFLNVLDFIQILCCACIILITPLKNIPHDASTDKDIAVLSLLSFSLTFLTIFFNNINLDNYDKFEKYLCVSDYYIKLLKKVEDNKNVQQDEKDV